MGLCLACDTRDGANTGWIQAIPLISCCFHYYGGLTHPTAASIWWPVQQQEQIALLDWSQPMVAANKLPLLSDPCLCGRCVAAAVRVFMWIHICPFVCVQIHVCMTQGDLFPIRKWNPLWGFSPSLPANHFLLLLHLHFPEPLGMLPHCNSQTSIGSIYLMDRSAEWLLLLSRPHKNHSN